MYKSYILSVFICLLALQVAAQNTIDGEAKIVPESEVNRQSAFIEAERGAPTRALRQSC